MPSDPLFDFVTHQVCQGRTLETTIRLMREEPWAAGEESPEDRAAAIYAALTTRRQPGPEDPTPDVLALVGDYPHNPSYIIAPLESAMAKAGLRVRFLHHVPLFDAESLAGARLLVVLRDGMLWPEPGGEPVWWMSREQEEALAGFVDAGGGFLALHNSTALKHIDAAPSLYRDVLGSSYSGHGPGDERFTVKVVDSEHPVTNGVEDYEAIDERHWPVPHADDMRVLLRAFSGSETSINGYVRTYGNGRVCYLASGHTSEMLSCASMQRLMRNAALWCTGAIA